MPGHATNGAGTPRPSNSDGGPADNECRITSTLCARSATIPTRSRQSGFRMPGAFGWHHQARSDYSAYTVRFFVGIKEFLMSADYALSLIHISEPTRPY